MKFKQLGNYRCKNRTSALATSDYKMGSRELAAYVRKILEENNYYFFFNSDLKSLCSLIHSSRGTSGHYPWYKGTGKQTRAAERGNKLLNAS